MTNKPLVETRRYIVYKAICRYAKAHGGNTPSGYRLVRICKPKMSKRMVRKCLDQLIEEGLIKKVDGDIIVLEPRHLSAPRQRS